MTDEQQRILSLTDLVRAGDWRTTYTAMSDVVYGHENGRQMVGTTLRKYGSEKSAHRILELGGRIAGDWEGEGGGAEEAKRRLRLENIWDESDDCARADRFIPSQALGQLDA